jgi:glycosyltransferase involved in cell wall biosynthesis
MDKKLKIAAIETFYGGSHRVFIDGLIRHSRHNINLFTLSDQNWRSRMKHSALEIFQNVDNLGEFDLIFATSLCNVAELKALLGQTCPPIVLYVHENQHTYPRNIRQKRDFQVEWIDFMNTVTADFVVYNSEFHRNSYHRSLREFIQKIPNTTILSEYWIKRTQERSATLYPGTDAPDNLSKRTSINNVPRIIWNHRWEYDKQPTIFLKTLIQCIDAGYDFELILLGKSPSATSNKYKILINQLSKHIIHYDYVESREDYFSLLASGDIVVSTAIQENFGLSIVEAIQCGCFPLLPNRLSYPELIPKEYHNSVLYNTNNDFFSRLVTIIEKKLFSQKDLCEKFMIHRWENRIDDYDNLFNTLLLKNTLFK